MALTCDRCGTKSQPSIHGRPRSAMAEGWSSLEVAREDSEAMDPLVICPDCLTEVEQRGVRPVPARLASDEGAS
jgi:hypothetical protein